MFLPTCCANFTGADMPCIASCTLTTIRPMPRVTLLAVTTVTTAVPLRADTAEIAGVSVSLAAVAAERDTIASVLPGA